MAESRGDEFERVADESSGPGLISELWEFLRDNKKWWMLPILAALLAFGALLLLSTTAAAPFIYTLF